MRFLLDHDVFSITGRFLEGLGHDVVRVASIGLAAADDEELLRTAQQEHRIFVTRDRDFGSLVFVKRIGAGVLYLRMLPATINLVHAQLANVLASHAESELTQSFVVVEPGLYRIRRPPVP